MLDELLEGDLNRKTKWGELQIKVVNLSQHVEVLEEMLDRLQESLLIFSPRQLAKHKPYHATHHAIGGCHPASPHASIAIEIRRRPRLRQLNVSLNHSLIVATIESKPKT
jgi:hypothetical protein